MKNASSNELDNYLDEINPKARKLSKAEKGKVGVSFIFYYLGHGVQLDGFTHLVLN
jgi:hypothetical protein